MTDVRASTELDCKTDDGDIQTELGSLSLFAVIALVSNEESWVSICLVNSVTLTISAFMVMSLVLSLMVK